MIVGLSIGIAIAFIVGAILGYVIARKMMKKSLEKNPPINREQIKAMYAQMGRKPSESQINQVMAKMKRQQN